MPDTTYCCRSCGAALEVRVGFKGTLVWLVDPGQPDLTQAQPELQGEYKEPRLVCSADVMHPTGFGLMEGEIVPDRELEQGRGRN